MLDIFSKISVKIIWAVFGGLVLVILGFFLLMEYLPKSQEIAEKKMELARIREEVEKSRKFVNKLEVVKAEIEHLDQQFKIALVQLPESKEIPELLTQISNLGTGMGLEILTFQPRRENPRDFYAEVPVYLKIRGRFHDILSFFDRVSKLPRIVTISSLQMGKVEAKNEIIVISCEALATTFRFIETSDSGKTK